MTIIPDRIYGSITIDDPLISKLIKTAPFQRLKRINQYGGVNFVYPEYQVTRFEHSLGVYHILRNLGTSQEVQIAGLLHDIGHMAFSHMIDMAMSNEGEDLHEQEINIDGMEQVERLLEDAGIVLESVDNYPQIKRPLPAVGADRIDYAIRDYVGATNLKSSLGTEVVSAITLQGDDIVFADKSVAKDFALTGMEAMWRVIYEPKVAVIYQSLIEMIRIGIKNGWLTMQDLSRDDIHVFSLLNKYSDQFEILYLNVFDTPFTVKEVSCDDRFDFIFSKRKVRVFDPSIDVDGRSELLSQTDADFANKLSKWIKVFEAYREDVYFQVNFIV